MKNSARAVPAVLALCVSLLAACSGSGSPKAEPSQTASPTPSATVAPTPTVAPAALNPLTGKPAGAGQQVIAVKIDNTRPAHPQQGVEDADIVYLEEVEGGLSRLCAVFSSTLPRKLGPVRSVRETDLELLAPYGKLAFAFSGGNKGVLRKVRASTVVDVSVDRVPSKYYRVFGGRHAPYNLFTNPASLLAARPSSARVKDVGFRFGPAGTGSQPATSFSVSFLRAKVGVTWSAAQSRWLIAMDGHPDLAVGGARLGADNVIVQFVKIDRSRFSDVNGVTSPITRTIGTGRAMYFRDGTLTAGTWSRKGSNATRWVDANGAPFLLKPGKTWVILVRQGSNVPVS
ncbi:MAG: hypothetical protein QOE64_1593 [Frankiales bacterium]|nr:hypothetical protein [Frankiales bacterium]